MGISRFKQWLFTPQWIAKQDTARATSLGFVMIPVYGGQTDNTAPQKDEAREVSSSIESAEAEAAGPVSTLMKKEG